MYSEGDLQDAVTAGVLSPQAAQALRDHVAQLRASPVVDEENFRLLTGFNDIFVAIAGIILLVAVGWLGNSVRLGAAEHHPSVMSGALVAAVSWGLAEYFTRQRRMALPSILLLAGFVGGVAFALGALAGQLFPDAGDRETSLIISGVAAFSALAAWMHWRRFMVPVTVAAGAADVAFWLHLTAAPMIAHSLFNLLGVFRGDDISIGKAVVVILLYIAFGLVGLAVDRRALLVSSLAYVLFALYALFKQAGAVELSAAFTALVIGSSLLLLSALWHHARMLVVGALPPSLTNRLPYA